MSAIYCIAFWLLLHLVAQVKGLAVNGKPRNIIRAETRAHLQDLVTWDEDSLFVRGERLVFYSGEFHPFRLPVADLWLDVFQKVKALGYNGVSFYINWALVEGQPGTVNTSGIFALEPFFDAASEAGIYLLARPGPYINAEVSGGGFPGWLSRINGTLRTNATDFLSATDLYANTVIQKIAAAQITNGGPVVLFQVENEYTYPAGDIIFPNLDYFDHVINQALDNGIIVPIVNNDAGPEGYFAPGNSSFGNVTVDIYGHDSYPLGFDCSNPYVWPDNSLPTNFRQLHEQQSPSTPYTIIEFQGGSFDPWGGPGFDKCNELINTAFDRVFYKNNWGFGITISNQYMIFGGTNWGNLGHPGGYTSYDYAASIAEDRTVAREKYSEVKLQANFLKVTPSYLTSRPANYTNGTYASTPAIAVTPLFGTGNSSTNLYVVRHAAYNSNESTPFTFSATTSVGNVTMPLLSNYSSMLSLNGRDSKVIATDYDVGGINLLYSSSDIFTWNTFNSTAGSSTILVLYGDGGEIHEFGVPQSLGDFEIDGTMVASQAYNNYDVFQWEVTPTQQVVSFNGFTVYLLWRYDVYDWWTLELPATSPVSNYSLPSKQSVVVNGGYLLRTAEITNGDLYITGEINSTTILEVIASPMYNNLFFNGLQLQTTSTTRNTSIANITYNTPTLDLPQLANLTWFAIDTLPELSSTYSDAAWTSADHLTTNNTLLKTTPTVLYASDYGYHTGPLLYRGHFIGKSSTSSNTTTFTLQTQGGYAYGYQVYLNDTLIYTYAGISIAQNDTASISLPQNLTESMPYTLTIIIDHNGLTENFNPGDDTMKQPRGILSYNISAPYTQEDITWKLTGNLGGENYIDKSRGPLNEGGFYFERQGYHLPYPPINNGDWTTVQGGPVAGLNIASTASSNSTDVGNGPAVFFTTSFNLSLPSDTYDIPLAFVFTNTSVSSSSSSADLSSSSSAAPAPIRAELYVNGYQFSKYVNNIGPQVSYPVPEGILNYNGINWVGVVVWNLASTGNGSGENVALGGLELQVSQGGGTGTGLATVAQVGEGRRRKIGLSPMDAWSLRPNAY